MDQTPAAMDRHLEVLKCHQDGGILLGASSLTGRYWYGSLWYYENPSLAPDVEKCTAGVQLESGLCDACLVDSTRVLVAMDTGGIALWELTDNLHTFIQQNSATEHDNIVSSVCVCHGNTTAVSASFDHSIKIWDLESFYSTHTYKGHTDSVLCVCSHPSQPNIFLTASQDGTICLWDSRKSKPATRLNTGPLQGSPTCVAWQPGQEHVYGAGSEAGALVVMDTRAAVMEHVSCVPHHRAIRRLQFSPHRNHVIATVSEDCTAVVVDVSSEQPKQLYRSTAHRDFVTGVAWSGDSTLLTCGWDARVISHTVPSILSSNNIEAEPTQMEVNGVPEEPVGNEVKEENSVKDSEKKVQINKVNGEDGDHAEVCEAAPS